MNELMQQLDLMVAGGGAGSAGIIGFIIYKLTKNDLLSGTATKEEHKALEDEVKLLRDRVSRLEGHE